MASRIGSGAPRELLYLDLASIKSISATMSVVSEISAEREPTCADKSRSIRATSLSSSKASSLQELHRFTVENGSINNVIPVLEAS